MHINLIREHEHSILFLKKFKTKCKFLKDCSMSLALKHVHKIQHQQD